MTLLEDILNRITEEYKAGYTVVRINLPVAALNKLVVETKNRGGTQWARLNNHSALMHPYTKEDIPVRLGRKRTYIRRRIAPPVPPQPIRQPDGSYTFTYTYTPEPYRTGG
jgi:hypothetical protein